MSIAYVAVFRPDVCVFAPPRYVMLGSFASVTQMLWRLLHAVYGAIFKLHRQKEMYFFFQFYVQSKRGF